MSSLELKDAIRQICMSHPLVEERLSHGEPTWFYKGKRSFAMFADHHHDERVAVWVAATSTAQEALIQSEPERYYRPPYVGVRGWVGIYLDVDVDWSAVQDILSEAYQLVSAKG
jgi:predicted DNA-binding protein (MmcQ/YjbR family)